MTFKRWLSDGVFRLYQALTIILQTLTDSRAESAIIVTNHRIENMNYTTDVDSERAYIQAFENVVTIEQKEF